MHSFMMGTIQIGCGGEQKCWMLLSVQLLQFQWGRRFYFYDIDGWWWSTFCIKELALFTQWTFYQVLMNYVKAKFETPKWFASSCWEMRDLYQVGAQTEDGRDQSALCVGTETRKRQGRVVFSKNRFRSSGQLTTVCLLLRCSVAQSGWRGGSSGLQVEGAMTLITNHTSLNVPLHFSIEWTFNQRDTRSVLLKTILSF